MSSALRGHYPQVTHKSPYQHSLPWGTCSVLAMSLGRWASGRFLRVMLPWKRPWQPINLSLKTWSSAVRAGTWQPVGIMGSGCGMWMGTSRWKGCTLDQFPVWRSRKRTSCWPETKLGNYMNLHSNITWTHTKLQRMMCAINNFCDTFFKLNPMLWPLLESSRKDDSNEWSQHRIGLRNNGS